MASKVYFGSEKSMNDSYDTTQFLHNIYCSELIHCADINLCHSYVSYIYVRPKLKVIGHFVRWLCWPLF